jgi:DNA invertase Pin-like site-specific DNA recombinase
MVNKEFGYARVSSNDQNEGRQIEALTAAGIDERYIFVDKTSGKDFDRPEYQLLLRALREGDILIIKSIDRLGRNYSEITEQWRMITKELKAHIKVLDLPLLDTTVNNKDLTGTFIADIVLQILSYVAETERVNIKQRQAEGIKLAREQGKQLGRPLIDFPPDFDVTYYSWRNGEITAVKAMKILSLKKSTFYKLVKLKDAE